MGCGSSVSHTYIKPRHGADSPNPSSHWSSMVTASTTPESSANGAWSSNGWDTTDTGQLSDSDFEESSITSTGAASTMHRHFTEEKQTDRGVRMGALRKTAQHGTEDDQVSNQEIMIPTATARTDYTAREHIHKEVETCGLNSRPDNNTTATESSDSDTRLSPGPVNIQFPNKDGSSLTEDGDRPPCLVSHLVATDKTIYPRDFFWWQYKKLLLGDYQRVTEIDEHVNKVEEESSPDLHSFLAELNRKSVSEAETVRAVFWWVATNIAYKHSWNGVNSDNNTEKNSANNKENNSDRHCTNNNGESTSNISFNALLEDQSATSTLERRYGNCQGFAQVLKYLLTTLDIDCEVIGGIAKGASYEPGCDVRTLVAPRGTARHCWNRVKVNGCWFLCDPTWAAKLELKNHGVITKRSGVRDVWFLTDPEIFISTHMPLKYLDETAQFIADVDEQILYNSVKHLEEWNARAWVSGSGEQWGVKPLSHKSAVIHTTENVIQLTFVCPHVLTLTHTLVNLSTDRHLCGYVMMYTMGDDSNVVNVDIRLPESTSYIFRIQGSPAYEMDIVSTQKDDTDIILTYKIISTGSKPQLPFTGEDLSWGHTPAFLNTGCHIIDYNGAVMEAKDGKATITIKLPTPDIFPNMLTFHDTTEADSNLDRWFYTERVGATAKVHFTCPKPSEYVFTFWIKTTTEDDSFDVSISFLIISSKCGSWQDQYPAYGSMWGIQEPAFLLGIKVLDMASSTLETKDGCCKLSIELSHPIQLSHRLENTDCENWRQFIYAEQDGDHVHYHFQIPVFGRFKFIIAGCEQNNGTSHQIAVLFLIENPVCFTGPMFPEHENCSWGARSALEEHGLISSQDKRSSVQVTDEGKAEIIIKLPQMDFPLRATLTNADQPEETLDRFYISYRGKDPRQITILVHLPFTGYYALRLYESNKGTSLASYFLFVKNPCNEKYDEFEPYKGIYGTTLAFHQLGLAEYTPGSSYFKTDMCSKCSIPIKVPYSVEMLFVVRRNESEVQGHLLPQRHRKKVVIHFQGQSKGFYQLRAYMRTNAEQPALIFVYLIENVEDTAKFVPFPDCRSVWGLNQEAEIFDITVMINPLEQSQSVLRNTNGFASVTLLHPTEVNIKASLISTATLPEKRAERSVLVEKRQSGSEVRVTVPTTGYFILMLAAAKDREIKSKTVGTFVIESLTNIGQKYSFPTFSNFYEGCRLFEPLTNPLEADAECYFKVRVPGAIKVSLWDTKSTWRGDLSPSGGDIFTGEINMGVVKEAWLTARFPEDDIRGEGGPYRNLLMFEVM